MTSRQRGGLVQEKEFGPQAWCHHRAPHSFKVKQADDPALGHIGATDLAARIMQATTIARQRAARWSCDDLAKGCHSILIRHDHSSLVFRRSSYSKKPQ